MVAHAQKAAWGDTPCHGDVFHIIRQCEGLTNTLSRLAKGATSRRKKLEAKFGRAGQPDPDDALVGELGLARQSETQAQWLARDIRTLTRWLSRDVLALAGPDLATRRELFDFIADELERLEPEDARRIRPVRVALRNQRDDLLAFAGALDKKLAGIAQTLEISQPLVREACVLHRLPTTSTAYWRGWNRLRAEMGGKFHAVFEAVRQAMTRTPRSSSLVENLNSRLRNYFTLRRHLGSPYLDLLRFFPVLCSKCHQWVIARYYVANTTKINNLMRYHEIINEAPRKRKRLSSEQEENDAELARFRAEDEAFEVELERAWFK